jgi:hypothetical protein
MEDNKLEYTLLDETFIDPQTGYEHMIYRIDSGSCEGIEYTMRDMNVDKDGLHVNYTVEVLKYPDKYTSSEEAEQCEEFAAAVNSILFALFEKLADEIEID